MDNIYYKKFATYISPKIVSSVTNMFANGELQQVSQNIEERQFLFSTAKINNSIYHFNIKRDTTPPIVTISVLDPSTQEKRFILSTVFYTEQVIDKLKGQINTEELIINHFSIGNMKYVTDMFYDLKCDFGLKAIEIFKNEFDCVKDEFNYNMNHIFNLPDKIYEIKGLHYSDYFNVEKVYANSEETVFFIEVMQSVYIFYKSDQHTKIFLEKSIYDAERKGFIGRYSYQYKNNNILIGEDKLKRNSDYLLNEKPIYEIKNNIIVTNDFPMLFQDLKYVLTLSFNNYGIPYPTNCNKEKLSEVLSYINLPDLNKAYVEFLWNPENNVKWKKGENGSYLEINDNFLNFKKSEEKIKFNEFKDSKELFITVFDKNSSILNTPRDICPEWANFVKDSYDYVLNNHKEFFFSVLKDKDFEKVHKRLKSIGLYKKIIKY